MGELEPDLQGVLVGGRRRAACRRVVRRAQRAPGAHVGNPVGGGRRRSRPRVRVRGQRHIARWGYTFTPVDGGTEVTESWEFLPGGHAQFAEWFGDDADAQIADRYEKAKTGIPETLAAIKRTAEAAAPRRSRDGHGERLEHEGHRGVPRQRRQGRVVRERAAADPAHDRRQVRARSASRRCCTASRATTS